MNRITPAKMQSSDLALLCENAKIKDTAVQKLQELGMPGAKTEHYRYFSIVPLLSKSYRHIKQSVQQIAPGDAVEIVDGEVVKAPENVHITVEAAEEIDPAHYDAGYYISHLLTPKVIKISISEDTHLVLKHRFTKEEALMAYRIAVEVHEGSTLFLDEIFEKSTAPESLIFYGMDIRVAENGTLTWIKDQEIEQNDYTMLASHSCTTGKDAKTALKTFDFGNSRALQIYKIDLHEKAQLEASHLLYADHEAQRGNIIQINHKAQHAHTTQNARHILRNKARGIFDGLIRVEHAGKYAVTHQNARSILLDNGAYMISKPQLEIYIDELEASHGSTTGQLDPDQIFYLRSRGISEEAARKMLIFAFAKDVIDTVENKSIVERLTAKFEKRYSGATS